MRFIIKFTRILWVNLLTSDASKTMMILTSSFWINNIEIYFSVLISYQFRTHSHQYLEKNGKKYHRKFTKIKTQSVSILYGFHMVCFLDVYILLSPKTLYLLMQQTFTSAFLKPLKYRKMTSFFKSIYSSEASILLYNYYL